MKKLWADKLRTVGKLTIHSKNYKWIRIEQYWNQWLVETCWHETWFFPTSKKALEKAEELIK